jgi:hypothetical protein
VAIDHRFIENAYDVRATIFLDLMQSLTLENHPHIWRRSNNGLRRIEERLRGTDLHPLHLTRMHEIMSEVYGRSFGNDNFATSIIDRFSCLSGVQQCLDDFGTVLSNFMNLPPLNFNFDQLCNGFMNANETVWTHFYDLAMRNTTFGRFNLLRSLGCTH